MAVVAASMLVASLALATPAAATETGTQLVRAASLAPRPAPQGSVPLGATPAGQTLSVQVVLSPSDQAGLSGLLSALYDPASPEYHHWLTPAQFSADFAPAPATVSSAVSWLTGRGLNVQRSSAFSLTVSAPAGRLGAALGTGFERYRTPSGAQGYVATAAPEVPAALEGAIPAVLGLNTLPQMASDLSPARPQARAQTGAHPQAAVHAAGLGAACGTAAGVAGNSYYTMDQLGAAYGLGSLYSEGLTGQGQTIGVFELAAHSASDVSAYESCFGLTNPVSTVTADGGAAASPGGTGEANLDIEQAATQAPGASIISYEGPNTEAGSYATWSSIVSSDRAQVISSSWDLCEPDAQRAGELSSLSTLFQQAAAQGQTILVASGDSGAEGCYQSDSTTNLQVEYPASDPNVTAVGGTSLFGPGDETTWNDCQGSESLSCAQSYQGQAASGGGLSRYESRPAYQPVALTWSSAQACGTSCRQVPDLSANSGVGMVLYTGGAWAVGDGTSFAAPFLAGVVADRNAGCASSSGLLNPALYSLAAQGGYGTALTDVTSGDNDMTGSNGGRYSAGSGWDGATGLGSPLPRGLSCPEVTSVSPASAAPGSTVTVSGTGLEGATVSFAGTAATVISSSATSAVVTVPASASSGAVSASGILGHGTLTAAFTVVGGGTSSGGGSTGSTGGTTGTGTGNPTSGGAVTTTSNPSTTCPTGAGAHLPGAVGIASVQAGGCNGYLVTDSAGQVSAFGAAVWHGDLSGDRLSAPIIAIEATPDDGGYWLLGSDGGVFTFGDAGFFGSTGGIHLAAPVVGMAPTPDGRGYWMVAKDGGVFSFGDAGFHGSTGGIKLAQPVDGIAVAPGGNGYWLVASDGGVFAFTSDGFYGSLGAVRLSKPIVGMSGTADGRGYTLVGSDGGVFSFGDAPFYGSLGANPPASPVVSLSPAPAGTGYYLVTGSGAVYTFGPGATNYGSV